MIARRVSRSDPVQRLILRIFRAPLATTTKMRPFSWRCVAPFVVGVGLCFAGEYLQGVFNVGLLCSLLVAALISVVVLIAFGRELDVLGTFPELSKLPIVRRWMPIASGEGNLP